MKYFSKTDIGKIRTKNQDQVAVMVNSSDQVFAIVCDGMGGHKAGEVASRAMINYVSGCFQGHPGFESESEIKEWIEETIQNGNEFVKRLASTTEEHDGMGTTIVLGLQFENSIYLAHVGDSRAYFYQDEIKVLTKDHTLLNVLLDQGSLTLEQAKTFQQKNVLVQAIGGTEDIRISHGKITVSEGYLLLCSDGLYNTVSNEEMNQIFKENTDIDVIGNELINRANENGGYDNISVVLVEVSGGQA